MPSPHKNILIISYSPLHRDPRVLRQINSLNKDYNLQTVGFTNANIAGIDFFEIHFTLGKILLKKIKVAFSIFFKKYEKVLNWRFSITQMISYSFRTPDAIFANDWDGLYAAVCLKNEKNWDCKIYFDSHEYFPRYRETLFWKVFDRPLINYVFSKAKSSFSVMSTVCPTLARMYEEYFGFGNGFVKVITNAPNYESNLIPQPVGKKVRMIHHGGAMKARQIEKMIDMMKYLPAQKYELYFMLVHNEGDKYYQSLVNRAKEYPNIFFLEPVPTEQISSFINQFDIGLFILNNKIVNYKYALPNKFFEFVQARLAIAVGNSPEMRSYIQKYGLGIAAKKNTAKAMAEEIVKLSPDDIMGFKQNAHEHAQELSAGRNIAELRRIANKLTNP